MFTIKGEISDNPRVDWSADGAEFQWEFDLAEIDVKVTTNAGKPAKLVLTGKRALAYYMWGHIDAELVKELQRFEQTGQPSDRLDEVRRSLGIADEDADL
jgi:hypothetical protein